MDEKTKLYVFAKKEVALIFLFMLLVAATSFVFGINVGKKYAYQEAGITEQDRMTVELQSGQEEQVNEIVKEQAGSDKPINLENMHEKLQHRIKEQIESDGTSSPEKKSPVTAPTEETTQSDVIDDAPHTTSAPAPKIETKKDKFSGKYTIQLGSHRSLDDAEKFAEGFRVRGYDPIINEVEIPGRGTWFRVSLGQFESVSDAKKYILQEKSLFQGEDYIIGRFD